MKCPHCTENYHESFTQRFDEQDKEGTWRIYSDRCPACTRIIYRLDRLLPKVGSPGLIRKSSTFVRPIGSQRPMPPPSVVSPYRDDYIEACAVLALSAKASAALSRRCLQAVLRDKGGFNQYNLIDQIQAAMDSGKIPSYITESLDAVRNIGNFAAHALKSTTSGLVLDVEPGEAEWNLDTLDSLFDYYFVQPELTAKRRAALDAKLAEAGKKPLK